MLLFKLGQSAAAGPLYEQSLIDGSARDGDVMFSNGLQQVGLNGAVFMDVTTMSNTASNAPIPNIDAPFWLCPTKTSTEPFLSTSLLEEKKNDDPRLARVHAANLGRDPDALVTLHIIAATREGRIGRGAEPLFLGLSKLLHYKLELPDQIIRRYLISVLD